MKKIILSVMIIALSIISVCGLVACDNDTIDGTYGPHLGELIVDSLDNLEVMFADDCMYPSNANDLLDISVFIPTIFSCESENLYPRRDIVEYKPELCCATWQHIGSNGVTASVRISKPSSHGLHNVCLLNKEDYPEEPVLDEDYYMLDDIEVHTGKLEGASISLFQLGDYRYQIIAGNTLEGATATPSQMDAYDMAIKEHVLSFVLSVK